MSAWEQIRAEHIAGQKNSDSGGGDGSVPPTSSGIPSYSAPAPSGGGSTGGDGGAGAAGAAGATGNAAPAPSAPSGGGTSGGVAPG
jgi:hypothetical protein